MNDTCRLEIFYPTLLFIFLPFLSSSQNPGYVRTEASKLPFVLDILPKPDKKLAQHVIAASESRFMYIGKYADTIKLTSDTKAYFNFRYKTYRDSLGEIRFYIDTALNKSGLEILVDPVQQLSLKQTVLRFTEYAALQGDKTNSIQTKKNYEEWLKQPHSLFEAMPVFVVNNTTDTAFLDYQDLKAFMIQEAMDEEGKWKPIEYWQYSGCGNSYHETAILPHHFIVIKIIRYTGNFETLLRVKLLNGKKVFYSNTFKGFINKGQFAPEAWTNNTNFIYNDPFLNKPRR